MSFKKKVSIFDPRSLKITCFVICSLVIYNRGVSLINGINLFKNHFVT